MKKATHKTIIYNPEFLIAGDRLRWIENAADGLRIVGTAYEIDRHSLALGYYLDPLCAFETVSGAVLQLPGRAGMARFVPALEDPFNEGCYLVDFTDVYEAPGNDCEEAKRDAARAADGMAERYAETEREYQTLETAKMRQEEARERICDARKLASALVADLRTCGHALPPSIRDTLKLRLRALRESVAESAKEIRDLTRNPCAWLEGAR